MICMLILSCLTRDKYIKVTLILKKNIFYKKIIGK